MSKLILLCDDHLLILQTLKDFIETSITNVSVITTESFSDFSKELASNERLTLAIIDYRMPGINGVKTMKKLINNKKQVPLSIMSGLASHSEVMEFIQLGAIGFIPKTLSGAGFINAINLMLCGEVYISPLLLKNGGNTKFMPVKNITERELNVLRKLHLGCSNKEIAKQLFIEEITVKVYVSKLFKKLNVKNRTQVVLEALSLGIIS